MKLKQMLFLLVLLCAFPLSINATEYYGVVSGSDVRVRKDPKNTDSYMLVSNGEILDLVDLEIVAGTNCGMGFNKVKVGENVGYICSSLINVYEKQIITEPEPANDCERALKEAGFPSSYWSGLCALKETHPNWKFTPISTSLNGNKIDWNASVVSEAKCGKNSMKTSDASLINNDCTNKADSGYSWVSEKAIKYYLDPRNFFNETNIFMFENQKATFNICPADYEVATSYVFNNNFMIQEYPGLPQYIGFATQSLGINGVAIASRIRQELGNGQATSGKYANQLLSAISGNYTSRWDRYAADNGNMDRYYNFFNVGVYDGNGDSAYNAVHYAYKNGWGNVSETDEGQNIAKAIEGGVSFLNDHYIGVGQNTLYFQKFNTFPNTSSSRYVNQYMTNVVAPKSESANTHSAYQKANLLDAEFEFIIPVYYNMDVNPIFIDTQTNNPVVASIENLVNGIGLSFNSGNISKIKPGTTTAELLNLIKPNLMDGDQVSITDQNGNVVDGKIAAGYLLNINDNTYNLNIYGDASGDGEINALDLLVIQKHILNMARIDGVKLLAADASKDGSVNALDLLIIQKQILGMSEIEQ